MPMNSRGLTNGLLMVVAVLLLIHLGLALSHPSAEAETFRLDACITDRPGEKPEAYLHVVTHGLADLEEAGRFGK